MSRYHYLVDGEGVQLKSKEKFRFACCDCGLVHNVVIVSGTRGAIGLAMERNKRATTMKRKFMSGKK